MQPDIITIDGPAASGKSTIGKMLAEELGFFYLDTGLMYRAATLAAIQAGLELRDEGAVTDLSHKIDIVIKPPIGESDGRQYTVLLDGQDVTWDIRSPAVDANVSLISSYPGVRREMVQRQRAIAARGQVVMVGRDIGTVVIPDAPLKFFVTASAAERARRRCRDRKQQGHSADYEAILADVNRRDHIDSHRQVSPLRAADDAVIIDTTDRTAAEVLDEIMEVIAVQALEGS